MSGSTLTSEASTHAPLTILDSCDRCGYSANGARIAQAFIRVVLPSGSQLTFCKHHGERYAGKLAGQGAIVIDETDKINVQASVSV